MKKKFIYILCIVASMLAFAYAYVPQVIGGKIVNQSDISGWQGMSKEMMDWNAAHPDDQTAWTGSMFGGMPTTTIHASTKGDWTQPLYDLLLTGKRPATYLFISLLGAWLLMLALGVHPLVALGGAVAVTFCSYNMQIIQVGHNTKMQAIAFLPWVLAALVFAYDSALKKKKYLPFAALGAALFGLALSFQVKANHPQITYYLALMILIYVIVLAVSVFRRREGRREKSVRFLVASSLLLVFGIAGIATNAIKLLPTYEYTPYSMRGGSSASSSDGSGTRGLDIDYATAWSYGWEELPNMLIPNFNGGSSSGAVDPDKSATVNLLRRAGHTNLRQTAKNLPLYWGPQPFTAGPMYMGAITIFLFILGLYCYKGKEKWWVVATALLAVFLALGSHFLWFTKLFYNCAPFYNKFRTVSMALVLLQFCLPVLACLVLDRIVRTDDGAERFRSKGWIAAAVTGGFCLLCAAFPGIAGSFHGASDAGMADVLSDALAVDRRHLLVVDALRSALFIGAAYLLLLWGCTAPKSASKTFATQPQMRYARRRTAALLVCALVLADLFLVDKRYLNSEDFVTPKDFSSQFDKRPVDDYILADNDPSYRVLDLTVNVFNDSHPSYWHKNIGGYSAAKLQRYQEFIESTLTPEINRLYGSLAAEGKSFEEVEENLPYLDGLARMNCRYIIVGPELPPLRYRYAKGNAWFVESPQDSICMTSYAPNELRYSYNSEHGGKAVFSEVYYPVGWKLTVDGGSESVEIVPEEGVLRAAVLPAGEHSLVMRFDPPSYRTGEAVSRVSSILLIMAVLIAAGFAAPQLMNLSRR